MSPLQAFAFLFECIQLYLDARVCQEKFSHVTVIFNKMVYTNFNNLTTVISMLYFLIGILLCLLVLLCALYAYNIAFYSPENNRTSIDTPLIGSQYEAVSEDLHKLGHIMERYPFEPVTITSFDGYKLFGRYYHVYDGAPVEILFHGYRGCAFRDCSGFHALSRKLGFNALVIDQRAHGDSECSTITFGIKERRDCSSWVDYCNARFGAQIPILLCGLSMGAATVLMATDLALPDNVCCVIADSPYSAPGAIIEKVCEDLHYPVPLFRPFIKLGAKLFGSFQLNDCTARNSVKHSKIPILLIHGEEDLLVPHSMSYEIRDACAGRAVVHIFPHAGHGLSYMADPLRYEQIIYEFLLSIPVLTDKISDSFRNRYFDNQT